MSLLLKRICGGPQGMVDEVNRLAFGPVPSRRLGQSLGINNIPPKVCSYSCVYCQLGRTLSMLAEPKAFYDPDEIFRAVRRKVDEAEDRAESIDFLTFVPDGEPTLDIHLGKEIEILRPLGIRIGVISNATLMWRRDVQDDLLKADWVSVKIDAVTEEVWRKINRPHRSLKLREVLDGIVDFCRRTEMHLATETMLVQGVNDTRAEVEEVAGFIAGLGSGKSYISVPTRPPAVKWASRPSESVINRAYQIFHEKSIDVECLIGYEGNTFALTGDVERDLLGIVSVHPMREEAVSEFLTAGSSDWRLIDKLIAEKKMIEIQYDNRRFYMRRLPGSKGEK
jgi:wyosine [tRNA(Phe)-imidazoG37] synthetase (radical SAM superfamily)